MTAEPAAAAGPSTYNVAELVTVWVVAAVIVGIMNLLNLCVVIAPVMVFVWARTATSDISVVIAVWAPPVMLKVVLPPETAAWVRLRRAAGFVVPIPTFLLMANAPDAGSVYPMPTSPDALILIRSDPPVVMARISVPARKNPVLVSSVKV